MKIVIFALLIVSQSEKVNSETFVQYMVGKLNNLAESFTNAVRRIKGKVIDFIFNQAVQNNEEPSHYYYVDRPVDREKMKNAFSEFVDEKYADNNATNKTNLKFYPGLLLATSQLALWHGREMESHIVQTKDGYFLTVHRLTANPFLQANRTVLLHHGLLGSSSDWILLGPAKSLPYILSDAGYDVWITNARGNYYSRGHISKGLSSSEYWKFSWQEMGEYDLPAVIDYIRYTKNLNESINFIGHSMGATALLVLLSTAPHYNNYLRVGILLAPLVYMSNIQGPIKVMKGMSEELIKLMGQGEFLPSRKVPSWLANKYCDGPKIYCSNPLLYLSGISKNQDRWDASFIARLLYHIPAGGSTNTLLHYMQMAHSGKFHRFNDINSEFPMHNVTLPIAMVSSSEDWLASVTDVLKLYFNIPNPIDHYILKNMSMSHTDFVWGTKANKLVFDKVKEYLEDGLLWNSVSSNEVD